VDRRDNRAGGASRGHDTPVIAGAPLVLDGLRVLDQIAEIGPRADVVATARSVLRGERPG